MSLGNSKRNEVEVSYAEVIDRAVEDFGDHTGLTRPGIIRWLAQFPAVARNTAAKALREVKYHTSSNLRTMARELSKMIYADYQSIDADHIFFVPIGGPGSGSQIVARHLKDLVPKRQLIDIIDLANLNPENAEVIVFIDDFSGTGGVIKEWWEKIEPVVLPVGAQNVAGILVLNYRAEPELEKVFEKVVFVEFLDETANVLGSMCKRFNKTEKEQLLAACKSTGCGQKFIKGWGDCGLLLAFPHGCPNNSLPILWYDFSRWVALFRRRTA